MPELRDMPYICDCGNTMNFEEEVEVVHSINAFKVSYIINMYPPRICEKCGDIMRRGAN